jgi:hypothetical protein
MRIKSSGRELYMYNKNLFSGVFSTHSLNKLMQPPPPQEAHSGFKYCIPNPVRDSDLQTELMPGESRPYRSYCALTVDEETSSKRQQLKTASRA